jgi:2-(1,2-epoxy-1,2-dihydrophenyl)acetyl-CoA isomerase
MSDAAVRTERHGAVVTIVLDRSADANSMNRELVDGLHAAVFEADRDESVTVLVIRGTGRFFCAGGDLAAIYAAEDPTALLLELTAVLNSALHLLSTTSLVVLAGVNGTVAGGGLGLLLNCDLAFAVSSAKFVGAYSSIAMTPDCGVSALLPRAIGERRAKQVLLGGQVLDAATALDWGLVGDVCDPDEFDRGLDELAQKLAGGSRAANGSAKRLLAASAHTGYAEQLADEGRTIAAAAATDEARTLMAAFLQKQAAR